MPSFAEHTTAVITGSSSGIGRAIAIELARSGAAIVVHGRQNAAGAEEVARQVRSYGRDAKIILRDLTDTSQHAAFVDQAWSWKDRVDIWINNAGFDALTGQAAGYTFDQKIEQLWQVDAMATISLSRLVGPLMRERSAAPGDHTIINIGWDQADHGMAGDSGEMFAAIKGSVMAFSKSLAKSLAPAVRVNCIAPGWIKTSWGDNASDYWQQRAMNESLLGRWGTPVDVARTAGFLASQDAGFINGQVIAVNGGFHRHE